MLSHVFSEQFYLRKLRIFVVVEGTARDRFSPVGRLSAPFPHLMGRTVRRYLVRNAF
jgi:hypothetical protein